MKGGESCEHLTCPQRGISGSAALMKATRIGRVGAVAKSSVGIFVAQSMVNKDPM